MAPAFKVKKQERDDPEYEDRLSPSEPNEPGVEYEHKNGFHDPSGRLDYRDLPPSYVVANYPMELVPNSPVGGSALNGATRQIPGTQNSPEQLNSYEILRKTLNSDEISINPQRIPINFLQKTDLVGDFLFGLW